MADINLSTGIVVPAQLPLDSKLYVKTLAELSTLGAGDAKAYLYYEGMIILCLEDKKQYIWKELTPSEEGLLTSSFTYPPSTISNGIDYSNREFNMYVYSIPIDFTDLVKEPDEILSGTVTYIQDLDFISTVITYRINDVIYQAPITSITLADQHPTLNRIDVFAVDTNGQIIVIQGTPAENPQEPTISFGTQLRVNSVVVFSVANEAGNGGNPTSFEVLQVYNENLGVPDEFDASLTTGSPATPINFAAVGNPSLNTTHIEASNYDDAAAILFRHTSAQLLQNVTSFAFDLQTDGTEAMRIGISLFYQGVVVGIARIDNGTFNFDETITDYQTIDIPIGDFFNLSSNLIDAIVFYFEAQDNVINLLRLDNVRFIKSTVVTGGNTNIGFLDLIDVKESSYVGRRGEFPRVDNLEQKLELVQPVLIPIDGCLVRKVAPNTDINVIETNDEVYFRVVSDGGGGFLTLMGQTYNGGGLDDRSNYTQNQSIDI